MTRIAQDLFGKALDFYWKKKWKFIRSARRRGVDLRIEPRIPTVGITGSVGKTTTSRMVAHILAQTGRRVGLATTQGIFVGTETVRPGDLAGGLSAGRLLVDPRVQAGVFEFARGGLIGDGTVLDAVDVGAVLNVYDNHVGLDGVADREGLARVKREVVRLARKLAVLNADDPLCLGMRGHVRAPRLCLVSACSDNPEVRAHLAAGGMAAVLGDQGGGAVLQVHEGSELVGSLDAAAIPATHGGLFRPAMVNALFAAAIAHGLGIDWKCIQDALESFHSTSETNPGRMNFHSGFPYELLITWAEGPQAITELVRFLGLRGSTGRKHLLFYAPGNRPDWYCLDMARCVAGAFDTYICSDVCTDWGDMRGRQPGEMSHLLASGLRENGVSEEHITVAPPYSQALDVAFGRLRPGDLLVVVAFGDTKILAAARRFQEKTAESGKNREEK
jgi:cyanophycin synthetase